MIAVQGRNYCAECFYQHRRLSVLARTITHDWLCLVCSARWQDA